MSEYDLRSAFPLSNAEFVADNRRYICQLAEVSDSRPASDHLSWYLVFNNKERRDDFRKLEIVTTAAGILAHGWPDDSRQRLAQWLSQDEQDGRIEWLE